MYFVPDNLARFYPGSLRVKNFYAIIFYMQRRVISIVAVLSLFGMLFMLNYTSPLNVGGWGVLLFFTMVFMVLFSTMLRIVEIFLRILKRKSYGGVRNYFSAAILAFGPIILLLVRRTGVDVGVWIYPIIIAAMVLGCFFVYKKA